MSQGHVMLDLEGCALTMLEKEILAHPQTGGIILFSRNYESKKQLTALTKAIRKIKGAMLIAVDQEGGRVQRFKQEFTCLPPFSAYGERYDQEQEAALEYAKKMAYCMAKELLDCGVNVSFSPVLDIDHGKSEVILDRSFHQDKAVVIELARAFIAGMHQAKMPATGKHFPGHGAVKADSHHTLPVDSRSFEEIASSDLQPFCKLRDDLDGMMPSHILYEAVDTAPTCFSSKWLEDILRQQIGFQGVIFSDDLSMAGAKFFTDLVERAEKALTAGCDMVLVCNQQEQAIRVISHLEKYHHPLSEQRLQRFTAIPAWR